MTAAKFPSWQQWKYLADYVRDDLKHTKPESKGYNEKEKLMKFLDKKAQATKNPKPKKVKNPVKWKCLDCNEIHDKATQILKCPSCDSENIKKITDFDMEETEEGDE